MDTVRITSGKVVALIGSPIVASNGKITGWTGVEANTVGGFEYKDSPFTCYQAVVTGTGAVTATVNIHGSLDGVTYGATALATITLTGNDRVSDVATLVASPYKFVKAILTNLTGTGASCYVLQGS